MESPKKKVNFKPQLNAEVLMGLKGKEKQEMPIVETSDARREVLDCYHTMEREFRWNSISSPWDKWILVNIGVILSIWHFSSNLNQWNNCTQEHSRMIFTMFYNLYGTGNDQSERMSAKVLESPWYATYYPFYSDSWERLDVPGEEWWQCGWQGEHMENSGYLPISIKAFQYLNNYCDQIHVYQCNINTRDFDTARSYRWEAENKERKVITFLLSP